MTIALSHGGPTIYSSSSRSKELLVGTTEGIVKLERNGSGWKPTDRFLPTVHISCILIEPESGTTLATGYKDGSVWASTDGGRTWEPRNKGLTETNVYSLDAAKVDGKLRLYLGTEPAHLFVSDDLGKSWTELPGLREVPTVESWSFPGPPFIAHTKHLTFDPRDASTMYASIEVGGLLKSTDGGKTWSDMPGMYEDVHRLVINPENPSRMYVSGGDGLYVSSDGGDVWEHWTTRDHEIGGYPDQLVCHPRKPELMFVTSSQGNPNDWRTTHFAGSRISSSSDGGRTWEIQRNNLPDRMQAAIEAMCLEDWGESFSIFAGTTAGEVIASEDGGKTWQTIAADIKPVSKAGHYIPLTVGAPA
jgi:photosystem II stability/assembly factor-like uncharacterized protein